MIRWVNDTVCFLDRPNPGLEAQLDAAFKRRPGLLQWDVPKKGALEKVASFISTVTSGQVSDDEYEARKQSCLACPALRVDKRGNKLCGGCSCGTWMLATLDGAFLPKLRWRSLKCPLNRF
jgi:hypothetical protein